MARRLADLPVLLLVAAACVSPEARRARGGGAGADPGNRGATVVFHDGAKPYYRTPCATKPVRCEGPGPVFDTAWRPD